jgi:hypothetical protein
MRIIIIVFLVGLFAVAFNSITNSADSIVRWKTADGADCWTTNNTGTNWTCCKKITVAGIVMNKCADCSEGHEGNSSCGEFYYYPVFFVGEDQPVNPKVQNYAKGVIGQGLAILNEETRDGGPVDPQVKNNVKALIERGLQALNTGSGKAQANPEIVKSADLFIDHILKDQKNKIMTGSVVGDNQVPMTPINPPSSDANKATEADSNPDSQIQESLTDLVDKLNALETSLENFEKATGADATVDDGTPDTAESVKKPLPDDIDSKKLAAKQFFQDLINKIGSLIQEAKKLLGGQAK